MLRFALLALIFYVVSKLLSFFFKPQNPPEKVGGEAKSKPLDVPENNIEDVDFKEVDD